MDTFTIILIVLGAALLVTVVVHEIRRWNKPGHHITQNAAMDSSQNNRARLTSDTNIHSGNDFGGSAGGL
jgi:hypothetical protein